MNDKGPAALQVLQNLGHNRDEILIVDPQYLCVCESRIGQGPKDVEDRANSDLTPRSYDVFHGAVKSRGEEETDSCLLETSAHPGGVDFDVHPQLLENICAAALAGDGAVTVFGHNYTRSCGNESRKGGDIEGMGSVTSGSAGVNDGHISGNGHPLSLFPHHCCSGAYLIDGLSLHLQGGDKRTDLSLCSPALHDDIHGSGHLVGGEIFGGCHL